MTMVCRNTTAIQPTSTGLTKVDSARDIVLVRSKIRNNSANTPKRGLKLYRLNSAKNTTTIRPVTVQREVSLFFSNSIRNLESRCARNFDATRLNCGL